MKKKLLVVLFILLGIVGCAKETETQNMEMEFEEKQKSEINTSAMESSVQHFYYKNNSGKLEKYFLYEGNLCLADEITDFEIADKQLDELMENRILVWQDTFDDKTLDSNIWKYDEVAEDQLQIEDGILKLMIKQDMELSDINIQSLKAFCGGRIEARIRFSNITGQQGLFLMTGLWEDEEMIHNGEMDIVRQYVDSDKDYYKIISTFCHKDAEGKQIQSTEYEAHSYNNQLNDEQFHIFAIEWNENEIKTYVDGDNYATYTISKGNYWRQFDTVDSACNPYRLPHFPMFWLISDLENDANSIKPISMEVDWIRAYAAESVKEVKEVVPTKMGIDFLCNIEDASRIAISDMKYKGKKGDKVMLGVVYLPKTVVDRTYELSVDDETIATISQKGLLTIHDEGIVTITARDTVSGVTVSRKMIIITE